MSPVIIIGGGGHAKVLIDLLEQLKNYRIIGFTNPNSSSKSDQILGIPILGDDEYIIQNYSPQSVLLVNGIGSVKETSARRKIFEHFQGERYQFMTIVHPRAIVSSHVSLGEGTQVMAGVSIQTDTTIGHNTIINTAATIDHDCQIGSHTHIATGAKLCGGVKIGNGVHIGAGSTIIQGIKIGSGTLVAAGSVVIRDIPENSQVMGVPARARFQ